MKPARASPERDESTPTSGKESESSPADPSVQSQQTQDTALLHKPATAEACSAEAAASPSTKDLKAINPVTKEPNTASGPFTDQPVEASPSQPSRMDVLGVSFPETAPKDLLKEAAEAPLHGNLAETVKPSPSAKSEETYTMPESKASVSLSSLSSEEKPVKTSVERLAEMVSFPALPTPLAQETSPRQPLQTHILPLLGEHSSAPPTTISNATTTTTTTTLIPLTPKIGMGKPAITKRKFSPGRPRVKQVGCWVSRQRLCHVGPSSVFLSPLHAWKGKGAPRVQRAISWCLCDLHS